MIRYLIIDDEPVAHDIIQEYCEMLPNLELAGHCYDAFEALELLSKYSVDLIFLDLNMPKLKGFDFLRTLSRTPKIVVTTAYQEYALEGYELNVVDYLLKPFDFSRFLKAVNKAVNQPIAENSETTKHPDDRSIFVRSDKKHVQVKIREILYLEAAGNYTKICLGDENIMIRSKLSGLLQTLGDEDFIQVHKSYVVAKSHIYSIEGNRINISGHSIPIGKFYKANISGLL